MLTSITFVTIKLEILFPDGGSLHMLSLLREQKGSVIAVVALSMTCLIGFASLVVDVGYLYLNKTQLQNMADAAVLAGAQDLPGSSLQAVATANSYAAMNGVPSDIVNPTVGAGNSSLIVTASRNVTLFFAPVLGISNGIVNANATVTISAAGGSTGVMPIGVVKQTFVYGQTYTLKQGGGSGYCGNYGALALGGSGGTIYRNNLDSGYNELLSVGDPVSTETGNMVGPTDQGVASRISRDSNSTLNTVQKGSPRIVILPIIDSLNVKGSSSTFIVGFAVFFLKDSSGGVITGNFMQLCSSGTIPGTGQSFGLYNTRLIQ